MLFGAGIAVGQKYVCTIVRYSGIDRQPVRLASGDLACPVGLSGATHLHNFEHIMLYFFK